MVKKLRLVIAILTFAPTVLIGGELDEPLHEAASNLTRQFKEKKKSIQNPTVTIFDLEPVNKSFPEDVGRGLAELLTNQFAQIPYWQVVERSQINRILQEQKLNLTGAVDAATAARVGRLGGVQISIVGSIQRLGANCTLVIRAVDTETGNLIVSESQDIPYYKIATHMTEGKEKPGEYLFDVNNEAINLTGDWEGPYRSSIIRQPVKVVFTLAQTGKNVSGTYNSPTGAVGRIEGNVNEDVFYFSLEQTTPSCPGTFNGVGEISDNRMVLRFSGTDCWGRHRDATARVVRE